jgi:hypothetical protein
MKSFIKKLMSGKGQAINKVKTNVPKTKIQKKLRDLKIATQKNKSSKAKLDQTIFEFGRKENFTFPTNTKKTESNKEAYKRIQGENTKVLKSMIDKATNKKDGGRIGRRFGSPKPKTNVQKIKETFSPKKNLSSKQMKIAKLAGNKNKIDAADFKKLRGRG